MSQNQAKVLALLGAVIFILAFLISGRLWFRIDMTYNNIFTISYVSRNLHREITDQVTITYFVSDRLVLAHPMPSSIADLLREYAAHSRGRIRIVQRDPARANLVRSVEDLGILPWQIPVIENNEPSAATVYSGILIEYLDRAAVIPLVFSLYTLEYDLSSRIRALVRNAPRELGVIVADAHLQWHSDFSLLNRELFMAGFNVRPLSPGEQIPDALPALFVLGGAEDLAEFDLYLIDRYITGGGNALFAASGVFVDSRGSLEARFMHDGGLFALLANYGVLLRNALVLDDAALNLTFQAHDGGGAEIRSVRYPHWIAVQEDRSNPNHRITSRFAGLDLYWASPLELIPPAGVSAEFLFLSTPQAWLQADKFVTDPGMVSFFEDERRETQGTWVLSAALSGIFPRAFEGADLIPQDPRRASRLVVIGDTDFAGDMMQ
ncbi:MAG: GldG family protein, partial [Treponema sp.]|nr:GldG family protein [Treponema sp.]